MCAGPSSRCSRLLLLPAHSRNLQGSQANNMDGGLATAKQGRWARGRKITRGDCHVWDIGRLTESGDRLEPHDEQKQAPAKHHVEQGHPASGTEPQMERPHHRAESKNHFRHKTGHGPLTATDVESLTVAFPSERSIEWSMPSLRGVLALAVLVCLAHHVYAGDMSTVSGLQPSRRCSARAGNVCCVQAQRNDLPLRK